MLQVSLNGYTVIPKIHRKTQLKIHMSPSKSAPDLRIALRRMPIAIQLRLHGTCQLFEARHALTPFRP